MTPFKYQGLKNNSSKIVLTLYPPITVLHRLTLDADGGRKIASLADTPIIPLFRRIALRTLFCQPGPIMQGRVKVALGCYLSGTLTRPCPMMRAALQRSKRAIRIRKGWQKDIPPPRSPNALPSAFCLLPLKSRRSGKRDLRYPCSTAFCFLPTAYP